MPVACPGCVPFIGWSRTEKLPPGPCLDPEAAIVPFIPSQPSRRHGHGLLTACSFVLPSSSLSHLSPHPLPYILLTLVISILSSDYGVILVRYTTH